MAFNLTGHNAVKPDWRRQAHRPEGRMIGIEFEIEHPEGYEYILDHLPEPKNPENRPVTESDGSLDEDNGVEIVFPPFKNAAYKGTTSYFAKCMKVLEQLGVESHFECGMHMNVNTTGWTPRQRGLFVTFFHWFDAGALANIGGRDIRDHDYCMQYSDHNLGDLMAENEHCCVAGLRPNRIEVRFPQATTDMNKVKNLTNFLELVEDFVKQDNIYEFFSDLDDDADLYGEDMKGEPLKAKFFEFLDRNTTRPLTSKLIKQVLSRGY